uniref:Uncharacterized protein n=1 Tax=Rhizophora mucronata TaxID=61149 RepID=A0A2P2MYZ6_RHIMU
MVCNWYVITNSDNIARTFWLA